MADIEIVSKFISPSTVWTQAKIYIPGTTTLTDPTTSIKITIQSYGGAVVVNAESMTKDVTGIYDHYYDILADPVEGWYPGEVIVVDGAGDDAKTSVASFGFDVQKGLS